VEEIATIVSQRSREALFAATGRLTGCRARVRLARIRVLYGGEDKKKKGQDINYWDPTSIPDNASHVIPPTPTKLSPHAVSGT
jgi:hypothetical protein